MNADQLRAAVAASKPHLDALRDIWGDGGTVYLTPNHPWIEVHRWGSEDVAAIRSMPGRTKALDGRTTHRATVDGVSLVASVDGGAR